MEKKKLGWVWIEITSFSVLRRKVDRESWVRLSCIRNNVIRFFLADITEEIMSIDHVCLKIIFSQFFHKIVDVLKMILKKNYSLNQQLVPYQKSIFDYSIPVGQEIYLLRRFMYHLLFWSTLPENPWNICYFQVQVKS